MQGDLPLLTAGIDMLSGAGVNILITEERKGSEATGVKFACFLKPWMSLYSMGAHLSINIVLNGILHLDLIAVTWSEDIVHDPFLYEVNHVVLKFGSRRSRWYISVDSRWALD